jgi:hypothetical protein
MEKFYRGTIRAASYTYKKSYEDYRNSSQYKKDLDYYKKQ